MVINPIALLAVAAGVNGLVQIAGKESPGWLRILAAAGVGVAVVSNLRSMIEKQDEREAAEVDAISSEKPIIDMSTANDVKKDLSFVTGKLLNWY